MQDFRQSRASNDGNLKDSGRQAWLVKRLRAWSFRLTSKHTLWMGTSSPVPRDALGSPQPLAVWGELRLQMSLANGGRRGWRGEDQNGKSPKDAKLLQKNLAYQSEWHSDPPWGGGTRERSLGSNCYH